MSYIKGHNKSGFKVGDKVKVLRKVRNYENGWNNIWCSNMNDCVGKIYEIVYEEEDAGFKLNTNIHGVNYSFPYFVLKKAGLDLPDDLFEL
jgi:hypothetical protein